MYNQQKKYKQTKSLSIGNDKTYVCKMFTKLLLFKFLASMCNFKHNHFDDTEVEFMLRILIR